LALPLAGEHAAPMGQRCEVCENFRPAGDLVPNRKLVDVSFGARKVVLCVAHARIAGNSGVTSWEELRELYHESEGKRSFVPRRAREPHSSMANARRNGRRTTDARS
jgi:hypothetical protein